MSIIFERPAKVRVWNNSTNDGFSIIINGKELSFARSITPTYDGAEEDEVVNWLVLDMDNPAKPNETKYARDMDYVFKCIRNNLGAEGE